MAIHMRPLSLLLFVLSLLLVHACREEPQVVQRESLNALFDETGVEGDILIYPYQGDYLTNDSARCRQGFIPASTYKILHTLIILETGAVADTNEVLPWDGRQRSIEAWNRDHSLRSAFQSSCVPCYQRLAHRVGVDRMRHYVTAADYGDMRIDTNSLDHFWLRGESRITLFEQVSFLQRLYQEQLPFEPRHLAFVKDIMIADRREGRILRGKTGWAFDEQKNIGWYVGWVERNGRPTFFALNITAPIGQPGFGPKRMEIARKVLEKMEVW